MLPTLLRRQAYKDLLDNDNLYVANIGEIGYHKGWGSEMHYLIHSFRSLLRNHLMCLKILTTILVTGGR